MPEWQDLVWALGLPQPQPRFQQRGTSLWFSQTGGWGKQGGLPLLPHMQRQKQGPLHPLLRQTNIGETPLPATRIPLSFRVTCLSAGEWQHPSNCCRADRTYMLMHIEAAMSAKPGQRKVCGGNLRDVEERGKLYRRGFQWKNELLSYCKVIVSQLSGTSLWEITSNWACN